MDVLRPVHEPFLHNMSQTAAKIKLSVCLLLVTGATFPFLLHCTWLKNILSYSGRILICGSRRIWLFSACLLCLYLLLLWNTKLVRAAWLTACSSVPILGNKNCCYKHELLLLWQMLLLCSPEETFPHHFLSSLPRLQAFISKYHESLTPTLHPSVAVSLLSD